MGKAYRVKLNSGRIIGPLHLEEIKSLYNSNKLSLDEEYQSFPGGDWLRATSFPEIISFVEEVDEVEGTVFRAIRDIQEKINKDDLKNQEYLDSKFETKSRKRTNIADSLDSTQKDIQETNLDKTRIRPLSDEDRKELKSFLDEKDESDEVTQSRPSDKGELEEPPLVLTEEVEKEVVSFEDKTQVLDLRVEKENIINEYKIAEQERKEKLDLDPLEKVQKQITEESTKKTKKKPLLLFVAILAAGLAIFEIVDTKKEENSVAIVAPNIEYPLPFEVENKKQSRLLEDEGDKLYAKDNYISKVQASKKYKASLEQSFDNKQTLGKIIKIYAELYRDAINKSEARQNIMKLIQIASRRIPQNINYIYGRALFFYEIERYKSSLITIERYIRITKKSTPDLIALYLKGLIADGRFDDAKKAYEKLESSEIKNINVYLALAHYNNAFQNLEKAREIYKTASKRYTESIELLTEYAEIVIQQESFDILEDIVKGIEVVKANSSVYYYSQWLKFKGILLAINGNQKEAISYFYKSLQLNEDANLRNQLAEAGDSFSKGSAAKVFIKQNRAKINLEKSKSEQASGNSAEALKYAIIAVDESADYYPAIRQLSEIQRERGHFKNSIDMLQRFIEKNPDHMGPRFDLIDTYVASFKINKARQALAKLKVLQPDEKKRYALSLAKLYLQQKSYLAAVSWLQKSLGEDPLNDESLFLLAEIYRKANNFKQAKNLINRAIEIRPGSVRYRSTYAGILYEMDGAEVAIGYLRSILEDFPEHPLLLGDIAKYYYKNGQQKQFEDQIALLKKLDKQTPELYEALFVAAELQGDSNEMVKYGNELITANPGNLGIKLTLSEKLIDLKKYDEALKILLDLKSRLDDLPRISYLVAKIYFIKSDFEKAKEMAQTEVKNNPGVIEALVLLGDIATKEGDFQEAKQQYQLAQSKSPEYFEALYGLGYVEFMLGQYERSLSLYQKAQQIDGNEPLLARQIGYLYIKMGQRRLAYESFKLYLDLSPDAPDKAKIQAQMNELK